MTAYLQQIMSDESHIGWELTLETNEPAPSPGGGFSFNAFNTKHLRHMGRPPCSKLALYKDLELFQNILLTTEAYGVYWGKFKAIRKAGENAAGLRKVHPTQLNTESTVGFKPSPYNVFCSASHNFWRITMGDPYDDEYDDDLYWGVDDEYDDYDDDEEYWDDDLDVTDPYDDDDGDE